MKIKKIINLFLLILLLNIFTETPAKAEITYNDTEIIYDYIYCHDGICEEKYPSDYKEEDLRGQNSQELLIFYGHDSNCDYFGDYCNSYNCINLDDTACQEKQQSCKETNNNKFCIDCTNLNELECREKTDSCRLSRMEACQYNYPYGQTGTLNIAGNFTLNGFRTYLDGYNKFGFHWFKTATDNKGKAIGFKQNSIDVYFGSTLNSTGDIMFQDTNNKIIWGENIDSNEYLADEGNNLNFHSGENNLMKLRKNESYTAKIYNGLEIDGKFETGSIKWQGDTGEYRTLQWSPILGMDEGYANPSRENKQVLFYYD